jgi:hypothetical protein
MPLLCDNGDLVLEPLISASVVSTWTRRRSLRLPQLLWGRPLIRSLSRGGWTDAGVGLEVPGCGMLGQVRRAAPTPSVSDGPRERALRSPAHTGHKASSS